MSTTAPADARSADVNAALGVLAGVTAVLALLAVYAPDDALRASLWAVYLTQYALVAGIVFLLKDRWLFVLSPSFVTASYMSFNNVLGAYCFNAGLVDVEADYAAYLGWDYLGETVALFLYFNLAVVLAYFLVTKSGAPPSTGTRTPPQRRLVEPVLGFAFCIAMLVTFSIVQLNLGAIGGAETSASLVRTLACLAAVVVVARHLGRFRYAIYAVLLLYMSSISSEDKREAIFLVLPVVLVECIRLGQLRLRPRLFLVSTALASVVLILIVVMSINRGYGRYDTESFWDAGQHVVDYVRSEQFLMYLGNNLEFNYAFYHAHQAAEYIFDKPEIVLKGSTFAKSLFVHVPRSLFPAKPDSMPTHYTRYHEPVLEQEGRSWMSTVYAEIFWNFHLAGLVVLGALYYLANRLFVALAYAIRKDLAYRHLIGIFAYFHMMTIVRGDGFDQYVANVVAAVPICLVVFLPGLAGCAALGRRAAAKLPAVGGRER